MPFNRNTSFADDVGTTFGHYDSTFTSDTGQVRAELFRRGDSLVAYVSFADGLQIQDVTDKYLAALEAHATEAGCPGRLRIEYSEN